MVISGLRARKFSFLTWLVSQLPVFQFHYTMGQTWTNPSDPTQVWAVPDELVATNVDFSDEYIDVSAALQTRARAVVV